MGRVYFSDCLSHNTGVLKRGQKLTNTLKTEEVRMYSSSLLRNGLWRKCLVTEYFPRVRLSQQTCLMALATRRWGVSGPATVDTHYTAGLCGGCWEETYTAREACAQGRRGRQLHCCCVQERGLGLQEFLAMVLVRTQFIIAAFCYCGFLLLFYCVRPLLVTFK